MAIPEIDRRSGEDILRAIADLARSYTPEWRFDPSDPDLGTALAMIYAELFSQTLKRFNRVPEKNLAAFFSGIDARLLPALPAEGYVCFDLAGEVEGGAEVRAGTPLLADAANEPGSTVFETTDDILVTAARPECIYTVCGGADAIVRSWDRRAGEEWEPFYLFDWRGENLQRHVLCLGHEGVLEVSGGAGLAVELTPGHQRELPRAVGEALTDNARAVWEYSCGGSWQPFASCTLDGNRVLLELGEHQLPLIPAEQEGLERRRWVRLRLREGAQVPREALRLVRLSARNENLLPDLVHAAGADQDVHEFYPFGQQLIPFAEAYFGCNEALVKRGALIEMTFNLDFAAIPLDYQPGQDAVNWKLIMKKSDFRLDEEYDVSVQEVLWEYFNGSGWARLFPDRRESDVFQASMGALGQRRTIRFRCPEDIQPVLVNASTGYFIRARALRIQNLYKLRGHYIVPVMEGLRFAYHYDGHGPVPEALQMENNRETRAFSGSALRGEAAVFQPFSFLEEEGCALYFGFDAPPAGGPVKLLFLLEETLRDKPGRLRWEYWGARGWESLNVVDETENLRQSGILTLMTTGTFVRTALWGEDLYWLRAVDEEGRYFGRGDGVQLPRLSGLYRNAVRVRNVATQPPQRFFIESEQKNHVCHLLQGQIHRAEVWVDEHSSLLPREMEELDRAGRLRLVRDKAGLVEEAWVLWEEREDFHLSGPEDRHYTLDPNEGLIRFSDGVHGRIPPTGRRETIEVRCRTGGGTVGNVSAGAINRSSRSLGFVNQIWNPRPTSGGCDQETFDQAVARSGAALRHGGRAVTARDFESLALESTRSIVRAKCFTNRDDTGAPRPGWVTLVVLLRDGETGGTLMPTIRSRVLEYITARCGGNLAALEHFHVVQPQFLELCVKAELTVGDFNQVFAVREELRRRLDAFLDPLEGNFDGKGWAVGRIPNVTQLRNCLNGVRGVTFLRSVSATAFLETGFGRAEVDLEDVHDMPFALPRSGAHTILITVE